MTARQYLLLSKTCVGAAAVIFAIDVLDSIYLSIVGSRSWDFASGRTESLNFLKGFTIYITPAEYWLFVGSLGCAGVLFVAGAFFYARLRRAATDPVETDGPD